MTTTDLEGGQEVVKQPVVKRQRRRQSSRVVLPPGWRSETDVATGGIRYVNDELGVVQKKVPPTVAVPTLETRCEEACAEHCCLPLAEFRRLKLLGATMRHHRGLNIQDPWSRLIMEGLKVVEARRYPLKGYHDEPLWLINTPGKSKLSRLSARQLSAALEGGSLEPAPQERRRCGAPKDVKEVARIVAIVRFKECYQYVDYDHWRRDAQRHRIPAGCDFDWDPSRGPMFAWVVESAQVLREPQAGPAQKGVIGSCAVTRLAILAEPATAVDASTDDVYL